MEKYRIEKDTMGEVKVPEYSYWGAQTQRAIDNFKISGLRMPDIFIKILGLIKSACAMVNSDLKLLDSRIADAIIKASEEVYSGELIDHFPVDVFQTGSGTSTNMNINEVVANKANELLGHPKGNKFPVHPNDHVNLGQSSNDVIPTCMNISAYVLVRDKLLPSLKKLADSLKKKSEEFWEIVKVGRTHLQDAMPVRLGQEFSGYYQMISSGINSLHKGLDLLRPLALGGTAVGTGINTHPGFAKRVIEIINQRIGADFFEAENHFEAQSTRDQIVELSGILNRLAVGLMKIAEDIRLLASGPRCGIGEIVIPEVQPGSSIMPGKVNPVIPEAVIEVAAQVAGNHTVITICGMRGILELNLMMPLMAYNLLQSIKILANVSEIFTDKCIRGIRPNIDKIKELVDKSLSYVTVLVPKIGYDRAASIAREAYSTGKTIREIILEKGIMAEKEIDELLNPENML